MTACGDGQEADPGPISGPISGPASGPVSGSDFASELATDPAERELLLRVLDTLLREDVVGLRSRSAPVEREDGPWLRLPGPATGPTADGPAADSLVAVALLLPVAEDGFQSVYAARLPLLVRESGAGQRALTSCGAVLAALKAHAHPADRDGFDAFAEECGQDLAARRLHNRTRREAFALLRERYGPDPARWTGPGGGLALETLAARHDHPVYPTARGRSGLGEEQLRAYAPEFHPRFALRWLALPREDLTVAGGPAALPGLWPSPADLGLPELDDSHLALPVHPLTLGGPLGGPPRGVLHEALREALRSRGLQGRAVLAARPRLEAVPTLSMRTVALAADPAVHLKLPLATATLGLRNRRTIKPGTLADGAACQRLLEAVIAREPRFHGAVLHADETVYAHAGHELLAALCRRLPAGLDGAVVVPMAALLSEAPGGARVIDHLADRFYGGAPLALLDACLTLLLDWQTTLFAYGIALESHQQNVSLVLDRDGGDGAVVPAGRTRLRLLFKDNDGPRINAARLREALGPGAPDPAGFADARILAEDDGPLTDLFTTITVHLCAGAYAYASGFACDSGFASGPARHAVLGLIRDRLAEAADRLGTGPGEPGAVLRSHVLDAPRLPVKAMVTAGTLLTKARSGAADINKHYTTGPNYLLRPHPSAPHPSAPHPRSLRIRRSR